MPPANYRFCGKAPAPHRARPAYLQRARRDIYANHLVPLLLKVECESACPRANIQDPPAHRFHRRPHVWLPIVERREIHRHIVRHVQKAVVPFDDFAAVYTRVIVVQQLTERVLVLVSACILDRSDSIRLTARRLSILPAHAIKGKQKGLSSRRQIRRTLSGIHAPDRTPNALACLELEGPSFPNSPAPACRFNCVTIAFEPRTTRQRR